MRTPAAKYPVTTAGCRAVVRHTALAGLSWCYAMSGRTATGLRKPRIQFIYLHHVWDSERDAFRRFVRRLAVDHQFLDYSDAVTRVANGQIDSPAIAFSIDDGLLCGLAAAEILEEFGVRGCFFVCPRMVGEADPGRVKWFCTQRLGLPFSADLLDWRQVNGLLSRGHEIGSHTTSHACLSQCAPAQLADEIAGSREILERQIGPIRHFAWPFGRYDQFSAAAARMVVRSGFVSCASASRGCHTGATGTPAFLHRDHIVAAWPVSHMLYFLARNANRIGRARDQWGRLASAVFPIP